MQLAGNAGPKKSQKNRHLGTITQLCGATIFATKGPIDNPKKNLLNTNISLTCPYNMVNFDLPAAEIVLLLCRTPANFNGFRVSAALLHGTVVVGVSQTLRR